MRVLMTTDTVGGVWTFTKELAAELLARDCAVALVSLGGPLSNEQHAWTCGLAARWGERFHFSACDAPLEWMQGNDRAFDQPAAMLLQISGNFGADVLLSSQFCFGAIETRIPRVLVAHSDVFTWADACRSGRLEPSPWLDRYRALVASGLRNADALVAPTHWMLHALARHSQLPSCTRVIPNGRTIPTLQDRQARHMQAVMAGRVWDEAKNMKLFGSVRSPMPIVIAGPLEHESAQVASSLGNARTVGNLDQEALLALFSQSMIYICASLYEPFGLAPLEAALCGCAVVANDIPSLREIWRDSALYFSNPESLSFLLALLKRDQRLLQRMRLRSHRRARGYSAARMAQRYLKLFHQVLPLTKPETYAA